MRLRLFGGVLLAVSSLACGGDAGNPISPTRASGPQYPSLIGGWSGIFTSSGVLIQTGQRATAVCNHTWVISSQNGGSFSGTFQSSGGSCAQGGALSGSVSTAGSVSGLSFSVTVGQIELSGFSCTRTGGAEVFAGVVSGGSMTLQASEQIRCVGNGIAGDIQRSMTLAMNRR